MNQCPCKAPKSPLYDHLTSQDPLSLLQGSTHVPLAQKPRNLMNQSHSKHQSLKGKRLRNINHRPCRLFHIPKPPQESKLTSATQEHIKELLTTSGAPPLPHNTDSVCRLARPLLLFRPPAAFPSHPIPLFTFTQCHVLHLQSRKPHDPTSAPPSPLPSSRTSRANQSLVPSPHHITPTTPSTLPPPNVKCRRRFANSMRSLLEFFLGSGT